MSDAFRGEVRSCEVCHREREICVNSSSFAAYSFASCAECLGVYAEPFWVFEYLRDWVDNPEGNQLKEEVYEAAYTYWDDQYMTYNEWLKENPYDPKRREQQLKEFEEINKSIPSVYSCEGSDIEDIEMAEAIVMIPGERGMRLTKTPKDDLEIMKHRLKTLLKDNIMEVTFTKKDGTQRIMKCTLKPTLLPEQTGDGTKTFPENVLPVWDVEKNAWRSFRVDSVSDYIALKSAEA